VSPPARVAPPVMAARVAGLLAVFGGVVWLVKIAMIWDNGGTNTTEGLVGLLFDIGALAILSAVVVRAWRAPGRGLRHRALAVPAVVVAFALAVNLPILLGWALFGRTWLAEELGILLTAVAAIVLGSRWGAVDHPAERPPTP
jgi:hypothetical protein